MLLYYSMARVGHSGMTADEVTENIEAAVQTVVAKLRMVSLQRQNCFVLILGFVGNGLKSLTAKLPGQLSLLSFCNSAHLKTDIFTEFLLKLSWGVLLQRTFFLLDFRTMWDFRITACFIQMLPFSSSQPSSLSLPVHWQENTDHISLRHFTYNCS